MQRSVLLIFVVALAVVLPAGMPAWAAEAESSAPAAQVTAPAAQPTTGDASNAALAAKVQAIEQLVTRQQQTIEFQQRQIEELKAQGSKSSDSLSTLQSQVEANQKAQKKMEPPSWLDGLKFSGDLRLRYEGIWLEPRTAKKDLLQHGRFRLRFGFEKKLSDDFDLGFRLASGKDGDPTTTNQTFTDDAAKKPVWIDLAYITWHPAAVKGLVIGGGKTKNPYVNTDMVWSADVNPEGVYESYKVRVNDHFEPFLTLGQSMLVENTAGPDATLLGYQPGANVYFTKDVVWTNAVAYYDFMNYALKTNFMKSAGNTVAVDGSLAAKEFNIYNFTSILKFPVCNVPVAPYLDIAKNADDKARINGTKRDFAYAVGAKVGNAQVKGNWQFDYKYARIDPDAIVGGFSDNSWGGSNRRGHKFGVSYGIEKNATFSVALYLLKPVVGAMVETKTLQADLVLTF